MRFLNKGFAAVVGCAVFALVACGGGGGGSTVASVSAPPVASAPGATTPPTPVTTVQWRATGSLQTARTGHSATLLPDGKVLVAGTDSSSVEIYDYATKVWTAVGQVPVVRFGRTGATLLPNGKLLLDQHVYDPISNTATATSTLPCFLGGYYDYVDVLLPNGKVLRAGGFIGDNTNTKTTCLFDPATNVWATAANMSETRRSPTATLLPNGKVLVAGGTSGRPELYDPASNTWAFAAQSPVNFWTATATLLANGKVLFVPELAYNFDNTERNASLYDPATDTWTLAGITSTDRVHHTATLLANGTVLIVGGGRYSRATGLTTGTDIAELYDPATNTWSLTPALTLGPRAKHTATLLRDGSVLVVGGSEVSGFGWPARAEAALYGHW